MFGTEKNANIHGVVGLQETFRYRKVSNQNYVGSVCHTRALFQPRIWNKCFGLISALRNLSGVVLLLQKWKEKISLYNKLVTRMISFLFIVQIKLWTYVCNISHFFAVDISSRSLSLSLYLSPWLNIAHSYQIFGRCCSSHCHHCRFLLSSLVWCSQFSLSFSFWLSLFLYAAISFFMPYFIHFLCWLVFLSFFLRSFYFHWLFVSLTNCLGNTFSARNGVQRLNYFLIFEF